VTVRRAYAKVNLGLVAGPVRADGRHEVITLLQRIDLHDEVALTPAPKTSVEGYADDTIVAAALAELARAADVDAGWAVHIDKRIPVAAGLGGGSSDAAASLALANATLGSPLADTELLALAARVGADVPFFLAAASCLATGDGTDLRPIAVPREYTVVLLVPDGVSKESTAVVYDAFDRRSGAVGFAERARSFERALGAIVTARDLAGLPANDLAFSPLVEEFFGLGAFRADVSGAGPTIYGLFLDANTAAHAEQALRTRGRTFVTQPV
jgi:4-diphosphocytidyl-2-C-methyl-D-erythritol kinase